MSLTSSDSLSPSISITDSSLDLDSLDFPEPLSPLNTALEAIRKASEDLAKIDDPADSSAAFTAIDTAVDDFIDEVDSERSSYNEASFDRHSLEVQRLKAKKSDFQSLKETIAKVKQQFPGMGPKIDDLQKKIDTKQASLDERIFEVTKSAFNRFYSVTLDSRPDLDPHLKSGQLSQELFFMTSDINAFVSDHTNELDPALGKTLMQCMNQLYFASPWDTAPATDETADEILETIGNLEPGQSCVIPGGSKGHAFLYRVVRLSDDKLSVTIINTGEDESFFKAIQRVRILESSWTRGLRGIRYTDKCYTVDMDKFDKAFIKAILPSANKTTSTSDVLAKVDRMLLVQRNAVATEGRVHAPQLRGSCTAKCVTEWLKDELIRCHGHKGRVLYEKFQAYRTRHNIAAISTIQKHVDQEVLQKVYREPSPKKLDQRLKTMKREAEVVLERRTCRAEELATPKQPSDETYESPIPDYLQFYAYGAYGFAY